MGRLDGKVAIVTGGARGQGGAEAALFRAEGAEVVITDVLADAGQAHAEAIGATFITHDVRSEEEWAEVVRQTTERHGRIDVLVNNAGIFQRAKLLDTSLERYRRIDRREPGRRVPGHEGGGAGDDRPAVGLDREHLLRRRARRLARRHWPTAPRSSQ